MKIQCINGSTIPDRLYDYRCSSFYVCLIPDAAKIYMDKHKDFIIFNILCRLKRIIELRY